MAILRKRRVNLEETWSTIEMRINGTESESVDTEADSMEERVAMSLLADVDRPAAALEDIAE